MSGTSRLDRIVAIPDPTGSEWEVDRWNHLDLKGATKWDLERELTRVQLRLALDPEPAEWLGLREAALIDVIDAIGRA